jgi:hypothetical protein
MRARGRRNTTLATAVVSGDPPTRLDPMSANEPQAADPRPRGRRAWALAYAAALLFAAWLMWPTPLGEMPLSADHPVHLARGWLLLEQLSHGHLAGWTPRWYFGFPVGELYPPIGDLLLAAIYTLGLGALRLDQAYALLFSGVFIGQGLLVVHVARLLGAGPLAAAIGGVLYLADPGSVREGGWRYGVFYGVWLQPVAVALVWWGFARLAASWRGGQATALQARALAPSALIFALALLSHPIAAPMLGIGAPLLALILGLKRPLGVGRALVGVGAALAVGGLLAAWWVLPLYTHRHWMSSYGEIYGTLAGTFDALAQGQWARKMSPFTGVAIGLGLIVALAARRGRSLQLMVAFTLALYVMHIGEIFSLLRLDWLSEGLLSLQFQRFVICAKPGLFIAAGLGAALPLALRGRGRVGSPLRWSCTGLAIAGTATSLLLLATAVSEAILKHGVGDLRTEQRRAKDPAFDDGLAALGRWTQQQWAEREGFFRVAYKAGRHDHSFIDATVRSGAPFYKIGFTPGEVFVHKPEAASQEMLDRLRVRYIASVGEWRPQGSLEQVASFGPIRVWERPVVHEAAALEGPGTLTVLEEDYARGVLRVRVEGADASSRVVFHVAGYPRWQLLLGDEELEWFEVPAVGDAPPATQAARRARRYREGSPMPPDGSEPMLIATEGGGDGEYTLRYRYWLPVDSAGAICFGIGALLLGLSWRRAGGRVDRALEAIGRRLTGRWLIVLALTCGLALAGRYVEGYRQESTSAVGWFYARRVGEGEAVEPGVMKMSRLLGPAVMMRVFRSGYAWVTFPGVAVRTDEEGERLPITGWYAGSDGSINRGLAASKLTMKAAIRPAGSEGPWVEALLLRPRARHGKQPLEIPTDLVPEGPVDLLIVLTSRAAKEIDFGFNLELGAPAAPR